MLWLIWPTFLPPSPIPFPRPGLPERGGEETTTRQEAAGYTVLQQPSMHKLSRRALHAKLEEQRQRSLFIGCHKTNMISFSLIWTGLILKQATRHYHEALTVCHWWQPPLCVSPSYRESKQDGYPDSNGHLDHWPTFQQLFCCTLNSCVSVDNLDQQPLVREGSKPEEYAKYGIYQSQRSVYRSWPQNILAWLILPLAERIFNPSLK